jgi:hypothetical protein
MVVREGGREVVVGKPRLWGGGVEYNVMRKKYI